MTAIKLEMLSYLLTQVHQILTSLAGVSRRNKDGAAR